MLNYDKQMYMISNNKFLRFFIWGVLIFACSTATARSRHPAVFGMQNQGNLGVSIALSGSDQQVMVPYWVTNRFLVAPLFQFSYFSKKELDLAIGLGLRYYFRVDELSFYGGVRLGNYLLIPYTDDVIDGSSRTDLFAGPVFGVEYFLSRHLSLGFEMQGNYIRSDERSLRFNNPGGAGFEIKPIVLATFYF